MRGLGDEDSNPPVDPTARGTSSPTHVESGGGVEDQRGGIPFSLFSLFALGLSLPSLLLDFSVCFTLVALVSSPWWSNELRNLWSRTYI
jgi:hypothetical protein